MNQPEIFRKKPVEIQAMQWTGEDAKDGVCQFMGGCDCIADCAGDEPIVIDTLEGEMTCNVGDWIIREPFPTGDRRFYPCKPDIFAATYDPVSS